MGQEKTPYSKLLEAFRRLGMALLIVMLSALSIWVAPLCAATPLDTSDCTNVYCHSPYEVVHEDVDHTASPPDGPVAMFPNNAHDPVQVAYEAFVDCNTCHAGNLLTIHTDDCTTCHPTPANQLGTWSGGCIECHTPYHKYSREAHLPYKGYISPPNEPCLLCHDGPSWAVLSSKCLNCHATPGVTSTPITTANVKGSYYGPAEITLSVKYVDKVGVGLTYYQLDGNAEVIGSHLTVTEPGIHDLTFWSVSQTGKVEPPKTVFFEVVADNTPPQTVSNAQSTYYSGGRITLTATDDGDGVVTTRYRIDDGPIKTGTNVSVPVVAGTYNYTLYFWSEDAAGNIEVEQDVSFTVISGGGTISLRWRNPPDDAWVYWSIDKVNYWPNGKGQSLSGWNDGASFTGIDNISVPVNAASMTYYVTVWYGDEVDDDQYRFIATVSPGQTISKTYHSGDLW